ncbi:MAG: hypothetical protein K5665_07735 [Saccharofermentans sp.]|nr:hypothetical protein [Saccharofermentans sp.]
MIRSEQTRAGMDTGPDNAFMQLREDAMIFDLERYKDEPLSYDDDKNRLDDQKLFLLKVKIRADMVDMLLSGVKAKDIRIRKLDASQDSNSGVINAVAISVLSDWGFKTIEHSDTEETDQSDDGSSKSVLQGNKISLMQPGEAKVLKKTVSNFKMTDSKNREGAVISALQDDFDAIRDQLNNELNVFPGPMREMIMMTLLDRFHSWERSNWENNIWD